MSRKMTGQRPPTINIISSTTYLSSKRVTRSEMEKNIPFYSEQWRTIILMLGPPLYQVGGLNMQKEKNTSYFDQWQSLYPPRRI